MKGLTLWSLLAVFLLMGTGLLLTPMSEAAAPAQHSIGYVGCSNSAIAVSGYIQQTHQHLFWENTKTVAYWTGGGSIDLWADTASSYWHEFDAMVGAWGQPQEVWVNICVNKSSTTYGTLVATLTNLKIHAPNALVVISPLNFYNPASICSVSAVNANDAIWADQAVSEGYAQIRGPNLGDLTPDILQGDGCHPTSAGATFLGGQMVQFFDSAPTYPSPTPTVTSSGTPDQTTPTATAMPTATLAVPTPTVPNGSTRTVTLNPKQSQVVVCEGQFSGGSKTKNGLSVFCRTPVATVLVPPGAISLMANQSISLVCLGVSIGETSNSPTQITVVCN